MTDQQPLLQTAKRRSSSIKTDEDDLDSNKQLTTNTTLSDWLQCFGKKKSSKGYIKLENQIPVEAEIPTISIWNLFRYATRIHIFLIILCVVAIIIHSLCALYNMVIFGQLTGLFVSQSFSQSCAEQLNTTSLTKTNENACPLGIELNAFNYEQLHRFCNVQDLISSSTANPHSTTFREQVMGRVYSLFISAVIMVICATFHAIVWTSVAQIQTVRIKIALFRSLLQRNMVFMDATRAHQLNSKLFDNITNIEKGIGFEFLLLNTTFFSIMVSLIITFVVNWKLTLIMLCIIPITIGGSMVFSKLTEKEALNELNTYASAGHIVQEVFSSVRTVLSLNGASFEKKRYEKELIPTRWSTIRKGAIFGVFMGWLSLIIYIVYATGFVGGALLISYGNQSSLGISDVLVIVAIFAVCIEFISFIGPFFQSYSGAIAAGGPVLHLIDEGDEKSKNEAEVWQETSSAAPITDMNGDIEFDRVIFTYPARQDVSVLKSFNLIARAGQTTALVGSSGSGKSTCVSLLLRFYEPSSGEIRINGQPIEQINLKRYRQNIGIVSQEPILFGMSIYENICLGKTDATRAEVEEAARQANAHHFIMKLPQKYETLVGERGIQLSGGEKQRVALARALIKQPNILILDEATSALDNISEKLVQEALDRACKNRTTIVIAHRLSTIEKADRIYVLDKGEVVEQGTHESLIANEQSRYHNMLKIQQLDGEETQEEEIMNMARAFAEDEQQIFERTRLVSGNQDDFIKQDGSRGTTEKSIYMRLLAMNRPEWITLVIGCIACLLNGAGQPLFAVLLSKIVGAFQDCVNQHHSLYFYSFLFLLLGMVLLCLRFFQYTAFAIAGSRLVQRIRSKAFACLLQQEVAYFDQSQNSSGAICARLSSEASALQELVGTRIGVICEAFALTFFGCLLGFWFNWQLTIITAFPFISYTLLMAMSMMYEKWSHGKKSAVSEKANGLATEVIQNLRTIKQLSVEDEILRLYSETIYEQLTFPQKAAIVNGIIYGLMWLLDAVTSALIFWRALILVERKELQASDIVMIYAFATFAMQAMRIVTTISSSVNSSLSAAKTFFALFDRVPTIDNLSTDGQILSDFRGEIEFSEVNFVYPSRPSAVVLRDFRLKISPGQRVALVGSSGCGKSTTIQLLERFYDPAKGRLCIDGVDIRQVNLPWIRSRLGLVCQEPILFDLTIAQNITYGLENVPMDDIIEAARKANIHEFIHELPQGYDTNVGTKGSFLSGGEKQRIAIARVLLRKPKILLLDEATSAMDSHNEQIVQEALDQAQTEDPTRTSLIIAHRLSTIRSCDLICVLERGNIVESGTHTELKNRRGAYYRMLAKDNS